RAERVLLPEPVRPHCAADCGARSHLGARGPPRATRAAAVTSRTLCDDRRAHVPRDRLAGALRARRRSPAGPLERANRLVLRLLAAAHATATGVVRLGDRSAGRSTAHRRAVAHTATRAATHCTGRS